MRHACVFWKSTRVPRQPDVRLAPIRTRQCNVTRVAQLVATETGEAWSHALSMYTRSRLNISRDLSLSLSLLFCCVRSSSRLHYLSIILFADRESSASTRTFSDLSARLWNSFVSPDNGFLNVEIIRQLSHFKWWFWRVRVITNNWSFRRADACASGK